MKRKDRLTIGIGAAVGIFVFFPLLMLYLKEQGRREMVSADAASFRGAAHDFRIINAILDDFLRSQKRVDQSFRTEWTELLARRDHKNIHSVYDKMSQTWIVTSQPTDSNIRQLSVIVSPGTERLNVTSVLVISRPTSRPKVVSILVAQATGDKILYLDVDNIEEARKWSEQLVQHAIEYELDSYDFGRFMKLPDHNWESWNKWITERQNKK